MKTPPPPNRRIQISIPQSGASSSSSSLPQGRRNHNDEDSSSDEEEHEFDFDVVESPATGIGKSPSASSASVSKKSFPPLSPFDNATNADPSMLEFPINVECTSLCFSPSGKFVWGGFSDGTIRVFDLSGKFNTAQNNDEQLLLGNTKGGRRGGQGKVGGTPGTNKTHMFVASKWCQTFGAVAGQIHARGVHTDLLTCVQHITDDDGDYVFGGVQRGAMELYAINVQDLELQVKDDENKYPTKNILDHLEVYVHSDAKLKGFGACTKLKNVSRPTYLLLTGTGIKNIHIWKFQPPLAANTDEEAVWEQLYDTPTNGNTISMLSFYRDVHSHHEDKLWAISKSGTQKLRMWDLSCEEQLDASSNSHKTKQQRTKRPPYQDVENSNSALGVAGSFCVCGGGPTMYNQLSVVSLDQPKTAYNHTELELPTVAGSGTSMPGGGTGSGRASRGRGGNCLRQVVNVAVSTEEPHHALLELDDSSLVHYSASEKNGAVAKLLVSSSRDKTAIPELPADFWRRTFCLGNMTNTKAATGTTIEATVVAMSLYNPNTQQGRIVLRPLVKEVKTRSFTRKNVIAKSPEVMDAQALKQLCMEAPPPAMCTPSYSHHRSNNNSRLFESPCSLEENSPSMVRHLANESSTSCDVNGSKKRSEHQVGAKQQSLSKQKSKKETNNAPSSNQTVILKTPSPTTSIPKKKKKKRKLAAKEEYSSETKRLPKDDVASTVNAIASSAVRPTGTAVEAAKKVKKNTHQHAVVTPATQVSPDQRDNFSPSSMTYPPSADDGSPPNKGDHQGYIKESFQPAAKRVLHEWSDQKQPQEKNGATKSGETPSEQAQRASSGTETDAIDSAETITFVSSFSLPVNLPAKNMKGTTSQLSHRDIHEMAEKEKPEVNPVATAAALAAAIVNKQKPNTVEICCKSLRHDSPKGNKLENLKKLNVKVQLMRQESSIGKENATFSKKENTKKPAVNPEKKPGSDTTRKREALTEQRLSSGSDNSSDMKKNKKRKHCSDGTKDGASHGRGTQSVSTPSQKAVVIKKQKLEGEKSGDLFFSSLTNKAAQTNLVANILCDLKSSPIPSPVRSPPSSSSISTLPPSPNHIESPPALTREESMKQHLAIQYGKIIVEINKTNEEACKNVRGRFAQQTPLISDTFGISHKEIRSKLQSQHRAEHVLIRRRLLRAIETTLRLAMEERLSMDKLRSDLKSAIQSSQEVLHDTMQRQKLEASCLADQQTRERNGMVSTKIEVDFPFFGTFHLIEDIGNSFKRAPGRPKSGK